MIYCLLFFCLSSVFFLFSSCLYVYPSALLANFFFPTTAFAVALSWAGVVLGLPRSFKPISNLIPPDIAFLLSDSAGWIDLPLPYSRVTKSTTLTLFPLSDHPLLYLLTPLLYCTSLHRTYTLLRGRSTFLICGIHHTQMRRTSRNSSTKCTSSLKPYLSFLGIHHLVLTLLIYFSFCS